MIVTYCDVCGKNTAETIDDLVYSREFIVQTANTEEPVKVGMTLCCSCKKALYYMMENPELLKTHVRDMKLGNRIRYLLKRNLKEG